MTLGPSPIWVETEGGRPAGPSVAPLTVLVLMILAFAAGFAWLSVLRHQAFQSHAFDLGNMDQAVWNTLHGHRLRFTDMAVGREVLTSRLAIHVEPILLPIALLYTLHSGPETLLVLQAVIVALGAVPAYQIGRRATQRDWLALVFPAAYLLHPSLQNAVLDDFHPVTLSACFLLWAVYFAWIDVVPGFAVFALLAASTKEDIGLLVAMLGLILVLRRRWVAAGAAIAGGFVWFLICTELIIPRFNPAGRSPYLERYGYLGHGLAQILTSIVTHPGLVTHVLGSPARQAFLHDLWDPLGQVPLLGLPILFLSLPSLAINMLSADPHMYSGFYQYAAELVPYVVASAAIGTGAASRWASAHRVRGARFVAAALAGLVLTASLLATRLYGFSPLADGYVVPSIGRHQALEARLLGTIPAGAVVSAADEIEPHLSDRATVYLLPTVHAVNGPRARYIILDASIPSLPVTPRVLHRAVQRALHRGYGLVAAQDGVLVLRTGEPRHSLPSGFFSFIFPDRAPSRTAPARWGPLHLVGVVVHPRGLLVNRSRPAISVETYWRIFGRASPRARIALYISPAYQGKRPRFSAAWDRLDDSPTLAWLPITRWPRRIVRVAFVPFIPDTLHHGKVDVAVGVSGTGPVTIAGSTRVAGGSDLSRLATVQVGY